MRGTWMFKAVRPGCAPGETRTRIREAASRRTRIVEGSERDALEFARRACEYLRPKGVESVEAWSVGIANLKSEISKEEPKIEKLLRFCLKPHPNGKDWLAEENELHHGGWWTELRPALDYALYRGNGRVCLVEIWKRKGEIVSPRNDAKKREMEIQTVVLVDRTGQDGCPTQGRGTKAEG
jgi:hypothetical protein